MARKPSGMTCATVTCLMLVVGLAPAVAAPPLEDVTAIENIEDISELTLEQLMLIDVTSVSGTAEGWFTSPAAIYVITAEDVRRSGARSLAEALRLAPGVFVGRTNAQSYSIGTRGFNGGLANKTLVLIDGRTVYDPLFSGTFWNVQDILLEDLDRIEVIRGPGSTLWGANAVNGVINVITKSAKDTQGVYLSAGVGTEERYFGGFRYGMTLTETSWLRVWGKYFERDTLETPAGTSAQDDWNMFRGGFRYDAEGDDDSFLTIQGDAYHTGRVGESIMLPVPGMHLAFMPDVHDGRNGGGNILFRFGREERDRTSWMLQGYYDYTERWTNAGFEVDRHTFDLEWRHRFQLSDAHEITWGLGARHTRDDTVDGPNTRFVPMSRSIDSFTAFIQDTITIVPDRLFAMIGAKFGHNDLSGFEFQPSARLWWTPSDNHMLWAAVSRPVRVPSRTEQDSILTLGLVDTGLLGGGPASGVIVPLEVTGDPGLDSEEIWAWEAGYRVRPFENVTVDLALFYNDYSRLIFVPPALLGSFNNNGSAETYGGELAVTWRPTNRWRLEASYSYVDVQVHGPIANSDESNTPHHQAQFRSYLDLTRDLELNTVLFYVDELPGSAVGDYLRLDLGMTWQPHNNLELSVWGQNLLDASHPEFTSREVERGAYFQATIRF